MDSFTAAYNEIEGEEFDKKKMIEQFESLYGKNTLDFRKEYESNGFEGNAEEQIWYQITR